MYLSWKEMLTLKIIGQKTDIGYMYL